jgi:probable rRNA maturation factor
MPTRPSYQIDIDASDGIRVPAAALRAALTAVLKRHGVKQARLGVALLSDTRMARLHRTHLNRRGSTDVLSFDLREPGAPAGAVDGELAIGAETARREALARGHALSAELSFYAVHGALHLLGHDDATPRMAARMYRAEESVLRELGLAGIRGSRQNPGPRRPARRGAGANP